MNASLTCPRCKTENIADQRFCQKCGFGLYKTDSLEPPSELARPEDLVGTVIGDKYRVLSVLGEGGFGTVFKVEQVLLGRNLTFALKLLRRELTENEHFRARFIREASIAMELVHPNAVQVRDFGVTESDQLYFTMDFCRGESLKDVLAREEYLTINRTLHVVTEVLAVLEVAHEKQIIHRDIKPENIFIERDSSAGQEVVRVGDFGLARNVASGSQSNITKGGIVGTPRYMSPEQSRAEALDGRSDLYAVGVIFYEMISGDVPPRLDRKRKPGQSAVFDASPQARLRENLPSGVVVPNAVLEVIARALESKPSDRFRNATEFREAIEKLPTYTPTYIEPRGDSSLRSWPKVALWTVAAVLVVGSLLAFTDPGREIIGRARVAFGLSAEHESGDGPRFSGDRTRSDGKQPNEAAESPGSAKPSPATRPSETETDSADDPKLVSSPVDDNASVGGSDNDGVTTENGGSSEPSHDVPAPPPPLGPLSAWVPFAPLDRLVFVRSRPDHPDTRVEYIVGQEPDRYGTSVRDEDGALRYWSLDDSEFEETFVHPSDPSKWKSWSILRWDPSTQRPLAEWQQGGYHYRTEMREKLMRGVEQFDDVIIVVAESDDGASSRIARIWVFEKGTGLVVRETQNAVRASIDHAPEEGRLTLREVRVKND